MKALKAKKATIKHLVILVNFEISLLLLWEPAYGHWGTIPYPFPSQLFNLTVLKKINFPSAGKLSDTSREGMLWVL